MTILLIDAPYLCYRAYFTTGRLENGTIYGFLSALAKLKEKFNPQRIAFCFDGDGMPKRKEIYPPYKENRKGGGDEEKKLVRKQIRKLRDSWLKEMGWNNVFHQRGYEADDVIASIVIMGKGHGNEYIIVSADHDLFQLLDDRRVSMYLPQQDKLVDAEGFRKQWGIDGFKWSKVKAIAGCKTDNVPGVGRVGEKTATDYLAGRLSGKRAELIKEKVKDNQELIRFNLRLVRLPYEGTEDFRLKDDEATAKRWREWCSNNKMRSLERRFSDRKSLFGG